jgi:two-component system, OmpR family, sensor histidine kinase KdpD
LRLPDDLPPVFVDASLVVQLITNLVDNFIKYTPAGSRATITAIPEGAYLRVVMDDDGPGLPPGDPARLFDKFQRGDGEGVIAGVGLGLAICRAIAQAHGGSIRASARPEGGARFEFTLPITEISA